MSDDYFFLGLMRTLFVVVLLGITFFLIRNEVKAEVPSDTNERRIEACSRACGPYKFYGVVAFSPAGQPAQCLCLGDTASLP